MKMPPPPQPPGLGPGNEAEEEAMRGVTPWGRGGGERAESGCAATRETGMNQGYFSQFIVSLILTKLSGTQKKKMGGTSCLKISPHHTYSCQTSITAISK
jgi:hypothetical protein